jgi:hypothetical protein
MHNRKSQTAFKLVVFTLALNQFSNHLCSVEANQHTNSVEQQPLKKRAQPKSLTSRKVKKYISYV